MLLLFRFSLQSLKPLANKLHENNIRDAHRADAVEHETNLILRHSGHSPLRRGRPGADAGSQIRRSLPPSQTGCYPASRWGGSAVMGFLRVKCGAF